MGNCWSRTGFFVLIFAALLLAFNWPLMGIPRPGALLGWLFGAWGRGVGLLARAARGAAAACGPPPEEDTAPSADDPGAKPAGGFLNDSSQDTLPGAGDV
ncbi:MAG: hypothetical protein HY916_09340 [Desulfovibrio sp.]|nr:hypothetical protein [Desulfovibrio sp.]